MDMNSYSTIIQEDLFEFLSIFGKSDSLTGRDSFVISDIPKFCNIFNTEFTDEEMSEYIPRIKDIYEGKTPSFSWITSGDTMTENSKKILVDNGFKYSGSTYGKILLMENFTEEKNIGNELSIIRVKSENDLILWQTIVKDIFDFSGEFSDFLREKLVKAIFNDNRFELYMGFIGDKLVCTGAIHRAKSSAGVYWISTIAEERKKGYATRMMNHILNRVKTIGYDYTTLQSSSSGYQLYKKVNFIHCCDFDFYSISTFKQ